MMRRGLDELISGIAQIGYHNHRNEGHSDSLSHGILADLRDHCTPVREGIDRGSLKVWENYGSAAGRKRRVDLLIGMPDADGEVRPDGACIAFEHKSVVTAHRNKDARYDDLSGYCQTLHHANQRTVIVGTVLIGTAGQVLNVPDRVKSVCETLGLDFEKNVLPRLSTGDMKLWSDFAGCISNNKPGEPSKTVQKFQSLPRRGSSDTHIAGFDYLLLIPVEIDNVNPPAIADPNALGIDAFTLYDDMIRHVCFTYAMRWDPSSLQLKAPGST